MPIQYDDDVRAMLTSQTNSYADAYNELTELEASLNRFWQSKLATHTLSDAQAKTLERASARLFEVRCDLSLSFNSELDREFATIADLDDDERARVLGERAAAFRQVSAQMRGDSVSALNARQSVIADMYVQSESQS
jgi:hypothetical protein